MPVQGRSPVLFASLLFFALVAALALPGGAAAQDGTGTCSSGARTLSQAGDRVYPDQGNGGYQSVHTDLHIAYDTLTNLFLPGTHADLQITTTQCLTDFSFDFERTALNGSGTGPNLIVSSIQIDGQPASFDFRQPTYPGNPNGPDDPNPAAHAISNANPVSATNPLPPACSPQVSGNAQNGQQCPATKLVVTPAAPIPSGTTITVRIDYSGRPGTHIDGDGSEEGWFRVNTTAAPNDGSFVTTEPIGSIAWMPLNNHPTAKPTYDIYDTVPTGKTAIGPGVLEGTTPGVSFATPGPTTVNPPDANFPSGSWTWHWHAPEPIANYLVTNTIGSYDLFARTSAITGIQYFEAMASGLTAARKTAIKAAMDTEEDITNFLTQFNGPFPFTANGVIVALPSVGFAEEMQTKVTFGNGASSTPSAGTFTHEVMHQWFGDHVSESAFRNTFWKEGWATIGEYLATARTAANAAGGLGTTAGDAAFDTSLRNRFNATANYGAAANFWTIAPSNPTVGNLFSNANTYVRPATAYLALRAILDASASRPSSDRWLGAMRQILGQYGGGVITKQQLEDVFHEWLPNQSDACHAKLDTFFTQWFDTAYPSGGGLNKPQITGPGLNGPGFYDDAGTCTRADQTIDFGPLADKRPGDADFTVGAAASSGLPVTFVAQGSCTISGTTVHVTVPGRCTITAKQAGDGVYKPAENAQSFDVHGPIVSDDAPDTGADVQYSDSLSPAVRIGASDTGSPGSALTAVAAGLPAGLSLAQGDTSDDVVRPGTRSWTVDGTVTDAPGSYPVTVTVTDDAGTTGTTSFTIVVGKEDAEASYTGDMLAFTPPGGSQASVLLRATVRDSSAVAGPGDSEPGDLANASVTLSEGGTTLCGPSAPAPIAASTTVGTVSCTVQLAAGAHTIDIAVGGRYAGSTTGVVEVAQPDGSFVTGGGTLAITDSAGTYAGDDGSEMDFAFNVKYAKKLTNLQGHVNLVFTSGARTYQVKSTAISSLGIGLPQAEFRSKANLVDITNPARPVAVAGNLTLELSLTDDAAGDTLGVTLWNGSTLLFSSDWTGTRTAQDALEAGSIVIH